MKLILSHFLLLLSFSLFAINDEMEVLFPSLQQIQTLDFNNTKQKTFVVIAAIGDYKYYRPGQGDLRYTVNDANKLFRFLINPLHGNLPNHQIVFLKNELATKRGILAAMRKTFAKAGKNDRIIFYFSGHGIPKQLMPYEAKGGVASTGLDYEDIKSVFKASNAGSKICFIDACYANSVKSSKRYRKQLSKAISDSEVAIMVSSQSNQTSIEYQALKQGVFSYFLIKGLEGRADKNRDKIITITELHQYVYRNVKVYTKSKQVPHTFGSFDRRMAVMKLR